MADETPTNAVEAMVRDGAEEQRARGQLPTPNAIRNYILPIIEQGERKAESNRLRIKPKPREQTSVMSARRSSPSMERELKRRLAARGHEALPGMEGGWTETREPTDLRAPTRERLLSQKEALAKSRLRKRIRLLLSKPDWREKMMQVNPLALNGQLGFEKQQEAENYVRTVIRDSCRIFGEWMAEPKKKIWSR